MPEQTIYVFAKTAVTITRVNGSSTNQSDVIGNALNGNAFSWENPHNLALTFGSSTTAITFDDADGVLSDDPFSGATVTDQRLTAPVTINGTTYSPSPGTIRWASPASVNVENEYEVTLFDSAGAVFRMVGVSITQGYTTTVVGVMFDGPAPAPGTTLYYRQGVSTYGGSSQTVTIPPPVTCFLAGTLIETPRGPGPIEDLRPGGRVLTLDSGYRTIRWIGRSQVDGTRDLAPVRIAAGALGNRRDLFVSPNHRMLLRSAAAELNFASRDVLVAAKFLVNGTTLHPAPRRKARYLHLLLDRHELVFAEGLASETLFTGPAALEALGPAARQELSSVVLKHGPVPQCLSRPSLTRSEAAVLGRCMSPADGVTIDGPARTTTHERFTKAQYENDFFATPQKSAKYAMTPPVTLPIMRPQT